MPLKTKAVYEKELDLFQEWMNSHKIVAVDETVVLAYFQALSERFSPNSMWTKCSMLKRELTVKNLVKSNVGFVVVELYLKQNAKYYTPKKS